MRARTPYHSGNPDPIDIAVGKRVRLRRKLLKMSQQQLAGRVGLTFQQVQKYERGTNRISASRLYDFATLLEVPVSFFFEDLDGLERTSPGASLSAPAPQETPAASDPLTRTETLDLVHAFWRLAPSTRRAFVALLRTFPPTSAADDRREVA